VAVRTNLRAAGRPAGQPALGTQGKFFVRCVRNKAVSLAQRDTQTDASVMPGHRVSNRSVDSGVRRELACGS